ncbi:uncharacterized protein LOC144745145 [Ciona intestinalis]
MFPNNPDFVTEQTFQVSNKEKNVNNKSNLGLSRDQTICYPRLPRGGVQEQRGELYYNKLPAREVTGEARRSDPVTNNHGYVTNKHRRRSSDVSMSRIAASRY